MPVTLERVRIDSDVVDGVEVVSVGPDDAAVAAVSEGGADGAERVQHADPVLVERS